MDESLIKSRLLYFIIPLIVCMLLGYLSHDLISGIRSGIAIGIGFLIGRELVGEH
jgi:positive regulator of sigma E activity